MSRVDQRKRGKAVAASLGQSSIGERVPGFDDFKHEVVFAGIWVVTRAPVARAADAK